MSITVATVQMRFTGNVPENGRKMMDYLSKAASERADIVHFSETALTGYAGSDIPSNDDVDWKAVDASLRDIGGVCRELGMHAIVGTAYRDTGKPTNTLLVLDSRGAILARYDKRFCTAPDVRHYRPGRSLATFRLADIRCGLLICYDFRFPELYRGYLRRGVKVVFHSFHQVGDEENRLMREVSPAHLVSRAAENFMYVVANNCINQKEQWFSTRIVNPDGSIRARLPLNEEGMLIQTLDPEVEAPGFYDATHENRYRAASGVCFSEL